ncbi:MAG TPA: hypothetical protein VMO81_06130, partial [Aestuariivirgaceae bacterium]|nr:hypothetical protein [Aestuariivirgaceae bacterium]
VSSPRRRRTRHYVNAYGSDLARHIQASSHWAAGHIRVELLTVFFQSSLNQVRDKPFSSGGEDQVSGAMPSQASVDTDEGYS